MGTALRLAHFKTIPADSEIHVKGQIRRALVSIDVGTAELLLAKNLGCDGVIAHHPTGGTARLEGYKVFERHVDQMKEAGIPGEVAEEAIGAKYHQLERFSTTRIITTRLRARPRSLDYVSSRFIAPATRSEGESYRNRRRVWKRVAQWAI